MNPTTFHAGQFFSGVVVVGDKKKVGGSEDTFVFIHAVNAVALMMGLRTYDTPDGAWW